MRPLRVPEGGHASPDAGPARGWECLQKGEGSCVFINGNGNVFLLLLSTRLHRQHKTHSTARLLAVCGVCVACAVCSVSVRTLACFRCNRSADIKRAAAPTPAPTSAAPSRAPTAAPSTLAPTAAPTRKLYVKTESSSAGATSRADMKRKYLDALRNSTNSSGDAKIGYSVGALGAKYDGVRVHTRLICYNTPINNTVTIHNKVPSNYKG